ncbi:MAG: class I SAM-dependent methyltransferase [Pseudomonadota bacterium]|nr:class I SAM-dependent methyltransferase [Pseudomonadota bacterium]
MTARGIDDPAVARVLAREHASAESDGSRLAARRKDIDRALASGEETPGIYPKDVYLSVKPDMGRFLYLAALTIGARRIVEFGTSFGISTIYFAAAARETGGHVTGSEFEPSKAEKALANLREAGLADFADIRVGDAMETFSDIEGPIDLLFLDGAKNLYLPVLDMLQGRLRPGSLVLADNIHMPASRIQPYLDHVNDPAGPFRSVVLPFASGLGYSVYRP